MKNQMLVLLSLGSAFALPSAQAEFRAHEWGTFTSLVGSDGQTVHGMYHEDEVLPDFVHGFGVTTSSLATPVPTPGRRPCRGKSCFFEEFYEYNTITQKMETPVIYFYTDETRDVSVNVKFPEGILTETYPAPVKAFPAASGNPEMKNGELTFDVRVLDTVLSKMPYVEPTNIYSHARNVESNMVTSLSAPRYEAEKFIFYRGLGRFYPQVSVRSNAGSLEFTVPSKTYTPQAVFLVDVNAQGDAQMMKLSVTGHNVSTRMISHLQNHETLQRGILRGPDTRAAIIQALDGAGLNLDEATAMVDTWEHGYLKVPGLRILYILPTREVDEILPLTITPQPEELNRVFVGRLEVMLDTEEMNILMDILIQQRGFQVASLGRFAEPKLRRVLEAYKQREHRAIRIPSPDVLRLVEDLINEAKVLTAI